MITSIKPKPLAGAVSAPRAGSILGNTAARLSGTDLDNLLRALEIDVVALTQLVLPAGHRVEMGMLDAPAIHFNLTGHGRIYISGRSMVRLTPHLLIIMPPSVPFAIEVNSPDGRLIRIDRNCWKRENDMLRIALPGETPALVQICGFFNAAFGQSVGLFRDLNEPVIEQFEPADRIDGKLREAMNELLTQEIGMGAMSALLLKQVIIALVRRSLHSSQIWTDRFSILSDKQITRAFADMVARPGAAHTVPSLAHSAGLSRSAFMARFSELFGRSPMVVLRDLRMRQAALDLTITTAPVDLIAYNAGYESRSSFVRAFRKAYSTDPTEYRQNARRQEDKTGR